MRWMRLDSGVALLCLLSWVHVAYGADDEESARQLFDQAHEAADRGDHAAACQMFEQSLALVRRASTLLNLGACQAELGRLTAALRYWQEGVAELPADDERVARAHERIASLEERIPRLRVVVPGGLPPGATVALDGVALTAADLDTELRVDPARHEVSLSAPGHAPARVLVTLNERSRDTVTLVPGPPLAPPVEPRPSPRAKPVPVVRDEPSHSIPIWVWPVGAIGLGLGIAAIPFAADYSNTVAAQHEHCGDDLEQCRPEPPGSYDPTEDNDRKQRDVIIGGVLAGAGAVTLLAAIIGAAVGERPERSAHVRLSVGTLTIVY